ncbi:MAG: DUF4136 domain-containing protein [Burkholderiales bacterium]|nr:DUF4136 domain-containing protein [Burkholderiales bacterium]
MNTPSAMHPPAARFMALLRRGLLAVMAAGLAACASAPVMRSEVLRFHAWQPAEPMSFAIRTAAPASGTLEHRSYEGLLRERLLALGFVEAPAAVARFQVEFAYVASSEVRRFTDSYWPMAMPGYGFGPGPWLARPGAPYWRYDPLWGMPPMPVVRDETVVRHELRVDLFDVRAEAPPGRKVWESRAAAYAPTESLPRLMPGLATAVFSAFPGESGSTTRVDVPLPEAAR